MRPVSGPFPRMTCHYLRDLSAFLGVLYITAGAIENAEQVEESAVDIDVRHVHVSMLMRFPRLLEAGSLEGALDKPGRQGPGTRKHATHGAG